MRLTFVHVTISETKSDITSWENSIQMETISADGPRFSRLEFIISKVVQNLHPFCFCLREFHLGFFFLSVAVHILL